MKRTPTRLPRPNGWVFAAIVCATIAAYLPALSAPFVMDDDTAVAESASMTWHKVAGSPLAGRPVVAATMTLNHALNSALGVNQGPDPDGRHKTVGYRALNVLFHLFAGALVFAVVRRAVRERRIPEDWRVIADPFAGTVCALWLLHPIQSEVINYVVQRTESIASISYLATLYLSMRAWDAVSAGARLRWYAAAVASCVLGMCAKEIVITAPIIVVLYDRAFRLDSWRAILRPGNGRGWFYLALAVGTAATFALVAAGGRGDTAGFASPMKWYVYFYTQCWAIARYLREVVWPIGLSVDYGEQPISGLRGIPGLILLGAFGLATVAAWFKVTRWGWFAFLGSWFFLLLAPSSSFVPIPTEVAAERRIYLALAAVLVLAAVCAEVFRRRFLREAPRTQIFGAVVAVALLLAGVTALRSRDYANPESLWRGVVQAVPGNLRGYVNLGSALLRARPPKTAEAETLFKYAIARDTTCRSGCAQFAHVLADEGRLAEAADLLERTLVHDPGNGPVERRLAFIYMKQGSFDLALPHIQRVAVRYPAADHLVVLAVVDLVEQRQQDGIAAFQRAAQLYPNNLEIPKLGRTLYVAGRSADAIPHLKELALSLAKDWQ